MIDFARFERRDDFNGIGSKQIAKAVKKVKKMDDAGDHGHVMAPWPKADEIPNTSGDDWANAKVKPVKVKKLYAGTMRLERDNLIWHIQNPGKSRKAGKYADKPQVAKNDKGQKVIVDGHHRLAADQLLGVKKPNVYYLK